MNKTCAPAYRLPGQSFAGFSGRSIVMALMFAVILLAMLNPGIAHASQTASGQFVVQPKDYFTNYILSGLLGDVVNVNSTSASTTLTGSGTMGEVFRVFNLGVAFFGSLIIMFIAVVGILNTGQDGEFLGKRWSSFWAPVRFAGGAAMMLPVTSSGYSFVQAMCLWIAGQGVGFADSVWSAIVDNHMPKTGSEIVAPVSTSSIVTNIFAAEVCKSYINNNPLNIPQIKYEWFYDNDTAKQTSTIHGVWWKPSLTMAFVSAALPFPTGGVSASVYQAGYLRGAMTCGEVTFSYVPNSQDPQDAARKAISLTHMSEVARIQALMAPLGKSFVDTIYGKAGAADLAAIEQQVRNTIATESRNYSNALIASADAAIANTPLGTISRMQATMKEMGFAVAGAFYMELAKTANAVRSGISAVPDFKTADLNQIGQQYGSENWDVIKSQLETAMLEAGIDASEKNANGLVTAGGAQGAATTTKVKTIDLNEKMFDGLEVGTIRGWSHTIAMSVLQTVIQVGSNNQVADTGGPLTYGMEAANYNVGQTWGSHNSNYSVILQLKNKGDTILNIAGTVYTAHLLATSTAKAANAQILGQAANLASGVPAFALAALENLSMMIFSLVMGLVTLGVLLAVIIPMTPFMIWVMGLAGLLILIIEALIASVLWAVMTMHPSGEGITSDHSRQGLMIMMMLFMRPTLMLMGMESGIFLVDPLVDYVNDMFYFVFRSTQQETVSGLFIIFGICSVYITIVLAIVRKSFAMIQIIPDRVLRWIGGGGEQLGESEVADRGENLAGSAGQRVSNMSSNIRVSESQGEKSRAIFDEKRQAAIAARKAKMAAS